MLMFPYAFSVPWWVRALVVSYDASAILIPMAAAVLAARALAVRGRPATPA